MNTSAIALLTASLLLTAAPPARTDAALPEVLAALSDEDADVRALAAQLLATERSDAPRVVVALAERLRDADETWDVRAAAAEALGQHASRGATEAMNALRVASGDESMDWRARSATLEALWGLDEGRTLEGILADSGKALVVDTGRRLLTLAPPAPDTLAAGLGDPDHRVRRLAALGLALAGDDAVAAAPALVDALGDADVVTRRRAGLALARVASDAMTARDTTPCEAWLGLAVTVRRIAPVTLERLGAVREVRPAKAGGSLGLGMGWTIRR